MLRAEDQMKRLAAITGVMLMATAEALAQDNPARPARRIVVSLPDRKLAVLESDRVIKIFPTAVGAPASPSPVGLYKIVTTIPDPTWYGPGKVIGPGKNNPIGTRWLGLSLHGYGIHGTNIRAPLARMLPMAASACATTMSRNSSEWWPSATRWNCMPSGLRNWTRSSALLRRSQPTPRQ